MLEYILQTFLSIDLFGLGSFITLFALSLGISYLVSNGKQNIFILTMIIINYTLSIGIFILTKEATFALLTTIVLIIIAILPDGTMDLVFDKVRGPKDE